MDVLQGSLFSEGDLDVHPDAVVHRTWLDADTWVDHAPGFVTGQLDLYDVLAGLDIWHRGWRPMFGEMVEEPRLSAGLRIDDSRLPSVVAGMQAALADRYRTTSRQTWLNWYRSGDDAVAWHADRIGRDQLDPPVAIVSLGATRRFLMRPRGGGPSTAFMPAGGDLLVMGGASQHRFEHAVPRSRHGGPRISVTFRPRCRAGVNRDDWAPVPRPPERRRGPPAVRGSSGRRRHPGRDGSTRRR